MSAVLPIKPVESEPSKRLTNSEKTAFTVTHPLTDIIIGLCLGDLYLQRQKSGVNTCLHFKQGICHNEYIYHLYDLFNSYCPSHPKSYLLPPDKLLNQPSSRSLDPDEGWFKNRKSL
jgi:hypothetical protein